MKFYVSFISRKLYLWRVTNMLVLLPFIFKNNFLPSKICCSQNKKFNKTYLFQIYCMETKYQVSNQHCHYCYYWIFRKPGLQLNSVYQYLKLALVEIFFCEFEMVFILQPCFIEVFILLSNGLLPFHERHS